jgi:hypothetical protein
MNIIYIAGPFRGDGTIENKRANIATAKKYVKIFIERNIGFYSPHLNIDQEIIELLGGENTFSWDMNFEFLKKCDAIAILPGWENSNGTKKEIENAKEYNLPVFYLDQENAIEEIIKWQNK